MYVSNNIIREYQLADGHHSIKTFECEQRINNELFKKFYVIDLCKLSIEEIETIFADFDTIQDDLVRDDYFNKVAHNLYIYFLYDDKSKIASIAHSATRDIRYAFKQLVTRKELGLIIDNNCDRVISDSKETISINNKKIITDNFNLLYARNGVGKTVLLNELGEYYGVTPANMMIIPEEMKINSRDSLYLQSFISERENKYMYFLYLMSIIRKARNNYTPILIDNLCWTALDDINQIKVATILNEASLDNKVFVTSSQEKTKKLIKATTYNPNIIEL